MASPNRLIHETSLYLKQHAHNPVDWHPWGPEALARARELDRPIFLSIGYSACHWCHVMEHESFENVETAQLMNERFVCIKVDREERPDLDSIYMNALQILTREGGGWPLSVFLTPDLTPFYAGTYYPPDDRYAPHRPSFPRLILAIHREWQSRRDHINEIGRNVAGYLQEMSRLAGDHDAPGDDLLRHALDSLRQSFDSRHGGFGGAPKFPHALELRLLLRLGQRFSDATADHMVKLTLDKMARGGMYDQIGGGFHRYSVDERWLVPHFEKMLYDNALLAAAYVESWQKTRDQFHEKIVRETLDYVLREMTATAGGFYSTQDADSEGEEGKFYVWSEAEILKLLGPELGEFACRVWGVTAGGNFEGHNILFRSRTDAEDAQQFGLAIDEFRDKLSSARLKLYEARTNRIWPGRDEKILTAWNGLMIGALAQAAAAFGEDRYLQAARNGAKFVMSHLRSPDGRLFRTTAVGQAAKLNGYLEDYAFMADALVSLYEAGFEVEWLREASALAEIMLAQFADPTGPGFFFTAGDHEPLIARTKEMHDGSTPSGASVAATVLLRLGKLLNRRDFLAKAEETLKGYRAAMADHPAAVGQMLAALDFHLGPTREIAVVGRSDADDTLRAIAAIRRAFAPHQVVAFHDPASSPPPDFIPLLADRPVVGDAVTVYVCQDYACQSPLSGAEAVERVWGGQ